MQTAMPPKIEELEPSESPNPFRLRARKTVIRESSDSPGRGLNKPQFHGNSPLDFLFQRIEPLLQGDVQTLNVPTLYKRLFGSKETLNAQYLVVSQLLDLLIDIQKHSVAAKENAQDKNMVTISLHDMRTFGKLVSIIVVLGVYPCTLVFGIGVPLERRRLRDFGLQNYKKVLVSPMSPEQAQSLLLLLYSKFGIVFSTELDVRDLLLKGTGYADYLTVAMTLCTVPHFDDSVRKKALAEFANVTAIPSTYELYQTYTLLLPNLPQYFKSFVRKQLQSLPHDAPKGDGLLTLCEFVLGLRDSEDVNVEKMSHVASVVLLKPADVSSVDYFTSIGGQCFDLLVNINRPVIANCVAHVLELLWLKNERIVTDFFLKRLFGVFSPKITNQLVLALEKQVNDAFNVLLSLSRCGLSPTLLEALTPVIVPLWSYYTFLATHKKPSQVAQDVLVGLVTSLNDVEWLDMIAKNLVYEGDAVYRVGPNGLVELVAREKKQQLLEEQVRGFIQLLDGNCTLFVQLLEQLDEDLVEALFVAVFRRWLKKSDSPFAVLLDVRLLEAVAQRFKDKLAQTPFRVLELVLEYLENPEDEDDGEDSDDEDESLSDTVLELLSAIISETNPAELDSRCMAKLTLIRALLKKNTNKAAQALGTRIGVLLDGETAPRDENENERRQLARAITNLNDPLVPIRAHGLYILRQLVESHSTVVDLDFAVKLHLVQLKDPDAFIYLNVIKGFESLLEWDANAVLPLLALIYKEDGDLDERLRIGEVLLRFVQRKQEAFSGALASLLFDSGVLVVRPDAKQDDRIRMSAMSILGTCCQVNPLGVLKGVRDALDCAVGILQLEPGAEKAIVRRSAIVLIHDLITGTAEHNVAFPEEYKQKIVTLLRYVYENDSDLMVREHARSVLESVHQI